ncbi:MAG: hypothetical protein ACK56F_27500 [bacterium]
MRPVPHSATRNRSAGALGRSTSTSRPNFGSGCSSMVRASSTSRTLAQPSSSHPARIVSWFDC